MALLASPVTQSSGNSSGVNVAATVVGAVAGFTVGGPWGAIIGGSIGAIATRSKAPQVVSLSDVITSVRLSPRTVDRGGVTYFAIEVVPAAGSPYRILRRYSQFRKLYQQVRHISCPFPRKHLMVCTGLALERRRDGLERWLQRAVMQQQQRTGSLANSRLLGFFLTGREPLLVDLVRRDPLARQYIAFELPVGAIPGETLTVRCPDGRHIGAVIPSGVAAGTKLKIPLEMAGSISLAQVYSLPDATAAATSPSSSALAATTSRADISVLFSVQVPEEMGAGQQLNVTVPDGRRFTFNVPDGAVGSDVLVKLDPVAGLVPLPTRDPELGKIDGEIIEELLSVTVPAGVSSGQILSVSLPDGRQLPMAVPPNVVAGQTLNVSYRRGSNSLLALS